MNKKGGEAAEKRSFTRLFEPLQIKKTVLRNRIVFPAVVTKYTSPEGFVTQGLVRYHQARAEQVGLTVTELSLVRAKSGVSQHLHVYDDKYIPGLSKLAQAIKSKGAAAVLQLCDCGARAGSLGAVADPIAPSKMRLGPVEARELSVEEIKTLVMAFADAARRGFEAGFDGVEVHAAHFYLISEFLSPYCNKRTDGYGSSLENRARFLVEIMEQIKKRVPKDFLILCRINAFETEGGLNMEEVIQIAQLLEQVGVDALSLSGLCQRIIAERLGKKFDWFTSTCPSNWPEGHEIKYAVNVKRAIKAPVIVVGKIFSPQLAENILELQQADLIAMARALIADPEWPRKVAEGRDREIARCKEDLKCLGSHPMKCIVNKSLPPQDIDILA